MTNIIKESWHRIHYYDDKIYTKFPLTFTRTAMKMQVFNDTYHHDWINEKEPSCFLFSCKGVCLAQSNKYSRKQLSTSILNFCSTIQVSNRDIKWVFVCLKSEPISGTRYRDYSIPPYFNFRHTLFFFCCHNSIVL